MPADPRDYKLDLSWAPSPSTPAPSSPRPFLSVHFTCCNVYTRIYRTADGSAYRGHCPRCAAPVQFKVGHGGTSSRSFIVG